MPFRQTTVQGFPATALHNDAIEVIALPGVGGRLSHLRRRGGREWLWRNPRIPFRLPPLAPPTGPTAYVDSFDSGGWDECFPTIAAGHLPGPPPAELPDHGELWCAEWAHELLASPEATTWRSSTTCRTVAARFLREVSVGAGDLPVVSFAYHLKNLSGAPFRYLWSAHPLLGIQPGTRLEVAGVSHATVGAVRGRDDWHAGAQVPWPAEGLVVPEQGGWAAKLFLAPVGNAEVILTDPRRGESLAFHWDAAAIPALGLWLNCGGWSPAGEPYWNVGIEPCLAAAEGITAGAFGADLAPILPVEGERSWRLTVTLREPAF